MRRASLPSSVNGSHEHSNASSKKTYRMLHAHVLEVLIALRSPDIAPVELVPLSIPSLIGEDA